MRRAMSACPFSPADETTGSFGDSCLPRFLHQYYPNPANLAGVPWASLCTPGDEGLSRVKADQHGFFHQVSLRGLFDLAAMGIGAEAE